MRYVLVLLLLIGQYVFADDMRPASLTITAKNTTTFNIAWKLPIKNGVKQNLSVRFADDATESGPRKSYVLNNAYREYWAIEREQGLSGLGITIEGLEGEVGDVLLRIVDANKSVRTEILNTDHTSFIVPDTKRVSPFDTAITYILLGIEHILAGFDHLLFVACLVYIAGKGKKLLLTITGFTIAHSITLILAATDTFTVPIPPVEAVIALSIVFLASEIVRDNRHSLSLNRPVMVSSTFGLLHGFGFASVLGEIGLPPTEKILALLCFNVGVEIGQLLFVASLLILGFVLHKLLRGELTQIKTTVVYAIGGVAMFWMIQRIAQF